MIKSDEGDINMEGLIIVLLVLLYFVVLTPIQYAYIGSLKEREKIKKQSKLYEDMSFEEEQIHFFIQSSILFLPATLIANLIYNLKHRAKKIA